MSDHSIAQQIHDQALALGYDGCGIISVAELREYADRLEERMSRFPEMREPFARLTPYARPEERFPWAKSVVVCALWYGRYRVPESFSNRIGKFYLTDMRPTPDSAGHKASLQFETFLREQGMQVDADPDRALAPLRWAAVQAGLGRFGKNNFFYTERGSWYWLEAWLIDAALEKKQALSAAPCPDSCGLCQEACPTGALAGPYATNATTCITAKTASRIPSIGVRAQDPLCRKFGGWLYGCDACQDACPRNRGAWTSDEDFPGLAEIAEWFSPEAVIRSEYEHLRNTLPAKFYYIAPDEVWKWKTNALNALRNQWDERHRPCVEQARNDDNSDVRALAEEILLEDLRR
ncbi:MAG: epoxyqueuosine reductase [Planctomycetes bacterium]|nr:epoxyqueuosine reductase [Planctomycetota bacterium]